MQKMTPDVAQGVLGVQNDGRLSPCPDMPNCVCSQFPSDKSHFIEALSFLESPQQTKEALKKVMAGLGRTQLVVEKDLYLRFEIVSLIWRFVDDVEFLLDTGSKKVHVRSASRLGYSDLSANRTRVEKIRDLWRQAGG